MSHRIQRERERSAAEPAMADHSGDQDKQPITIKKYANRRLYNTATSSYVTLDHLCQMVKDGHDFVVYDAKSGEDITRSVLTQIIFEEESKGQNLLPIRFLRQLIRFYDDSLQALVPGYLEVSMESFTRNQEQMRKNLTEALGEMSPFRQFEELSRQNLAMFQRAMTMFGGAPGAPGGGEAGAESAEGEERTAEDEIAELRSKLEEMEHQIDALAKKK
jgi:polyhydroxyalkanoate synthesis repressor PhaR